MNDCFGLAIEESGKEFDARAYSIAHGNLNYRHLSV